MTRHLAGSPPWTNEPLPPGSVIVARELLPSETVELAKSGVVAIVSEHGGKFSHTAIVARSLGIPAITGISNVTSQIQPGMRLLVDGETGKRSDRTFTVGRGKFCKTEAGIRTSRNFDRGKRETAVCYSGRHRNLTARQYRPPRGGWSASRNTILPASAYFVPSFSFSNRTSVRVSRCSARCMTAWPEALMTCRWSSARSILAATNCRLFFCRKDRKRMPVFTCGVCDSH